MFKKIKANRTYKNIMQQFDAIITQNKKQYDSFRDPLGSRGSSIDKTQRMRGSTKNENTLVNLEYYVSNGFTQNIVDMPAEDATREWIEITTSKDTEEKNISRMIENRMKELKIREKIENLIRYSRMYPKGSMLYYAVLSNKVQEGNELAEPLPIDDITQIEFINVIDNPGNISITTINKGQPTKADYNKPEISINGQKIHESRISWLVKSWIPELDTGISVIKTISDAIQAQDSALWSTNSILSQLATKIFKSDFIADLDITKRAELLAAMKHIMDTQSIIALMQDEDFIQQVYNVTGIKEIFDNVFDNMSGLARMPKNIILGKAHGVVTAGEYDTLNYYAQIATFQENKIRPIIEKIIDLIVREKNGDVYKTIGSNPDNIDVEFTFNSLWKLDPLSQADTDLKNSQRDQIDITVGKVSPQEARENDTRLANLENFEVEREIDPNMDMPPLVEPKINE
jgi:phage-related protein (TIGR01555 family)